MPQSRKWQLTVNNPLEKGITHEVLKESLAKFTGMVYWCMCDETGSEGTYHTHVYFVLRTPTVHTVVDNRFPSIHRENVKGTSQQNRDYVLKDGEKYNKSPDGSYNYIDGSGKTHVGVNHTDTFEEWGEMPIERQGKSKDVEKIYSLIKDGATNLEIIDAVSSSVPTLYSSSLYQGIKITRSGYTGGYNGIPYTEYWGTKLNYIDKEYRWSSSQSVVADFSYDTYKNQWVSMRITISGDKLYYFVNGDLVGSGSFTKPSADKFYIKSSGTVYLDELRVSTGSLSSTGMYNPSSSPFDTNKVLALPDDLVPNTIYVQSDIEVKNIRVGGVRPSNPGRGFLYIPLYGDYTAAQPQLYDGSDWISVTCMVHNGDTTVDVSKLVTW